MSNAAEPETTTLLELKQALEKASAHAWRLTELKAQVAAGLYRVDVERLAERLLDELE